MKCEICREELPSPDASGYQREHIIERCRDALVSQLAAERERREAAERERDELRELLIKSVPERLVGDAETGCAACGETFSSRLGTELKFSRDSALAAQKQAEERATGLLSETYDLAVIAYGADDSVTYEYKKRLDAALASQPADERGEEKSKCTAQGKTSETSGSGNRESHPKASQDGAVRIETSRRADAPQEPGTSSDALASQPADERGEERGEEQSK